MRSQHIFPVTSSCRLSLLTALWGERIKETLQTKEKCGERVSAWAEQGGQQTPTLSELDAEDFVRKHTQPLLSQCERQKTMMRRTRRAGWRGGQRRLLNLAQRKPDVGSRSPLTYLRPGTEILFVGGHSTFPISACEISEQGGGTICTRASNSADNGVVFNKTDFCYTAEQPEHCSPSCCTFLLLKPLRWRMICPHSYYIQQNYFLLTALI